MDLPQETGGAAAGGPAAQQQEAAAGGEGSAPEIGQASGRSGEAARQACSATHRARASSSPVWTHGCWWIDTAVPLVAGSEDAECVGEREEQAVAFELDGEEEQEDDERARASIA